MSAPFNLPFHRLENCFLSIPAAGNFDLTAYKRHFYKPETVSVGTDGSLKVGNFLYSYNPVAAARLLATHPGNLEIAGLWELTPEVCEALSHHSGVLRLFTTKKEQICDAAAAALGKHQGQLIICRTCGVLSDGVMEGLSRHRGGLKIAGLRYLSASGAQALAAHEGFIDFPWMWHLSLEAAEALANHKGGLSFMLDLWSNGATRRKSTTKEWQLELPYYRNERLKILGFLAQAEGELGLGNLENISEEEVEVLASTEGTLSLAGIDWSRPGFATALANHRGRLMLGTPFSISEANARALSEHRGGLDLLGNWHPRSGSRPRLPKYLEMFVLAATGGTLSFTLFRNLSKSEAKVLASHQGPLGLDCDGDLSPLAARALANHKFPLELRVDRVSPRAAEELLSHPGPLTLTVTESFSKETAQILSQYSGELICESQTMDQILGYAGEAIGQVGKRSRYYRADYGDCPAGCNC